MKPYPCFLVALSSQVFLRILIRNFKNSLCSWIISVFSKIGCLVFVSQSVSHTTSFFSCEGMLGSLFVFGSERLSSLSKEAVWFHSLLSPSLHLPTGSLPPMHDNWPAGFIFRRVWNPTHVRICPTLGTPENSLPIPCFLKFIFDRHFNSLSWRKEKQKLKHPWTVSDTWTKTHFRSL